MTRKEFIDLCKALGIGLPISSLYSSCNNDSEGINQNEKVIIVGAGPGGLTAGHLLRQKGIDFEILEASSS